MKHSHRPRTPWTRGIVTLALTLASVSGWRVCQAESLKAESRMPFRHVIPLRDAAGDQITLPPALNDEGKPQEAQASPLSVAQTCGRCHEYSVIGQGWHFNAGRDVVPSGRPGEPWILTDAATRTQLPISYRGWSGTFKPAEVGLSDYDFLLAFARHHPGGGMGEPPSDQINTNDVRLRRMVVTGVMEVDCLICHTQYGEYDHEARYKALTSEAFRWAPTLAAELGVYGANRGAKAFADSWRPPRPPPSRLPGIKYERRRFDAADFVTFSVTRRPPAQNCYYCHSSESHLGDDRWHSDRDVHLRAGMLCVDCHRNGIDHQVVRGYEGEVADRRVTEEMIGLRVKMLLRDDAGLSEADAHRKAEEQLKEELGRVETLSCRGCHYGAEDGMTGGRLGAPHPEHHGFPPIHFEKLSCTACHSGPVPEDATQIVHTSLAHKLGLPAPARGANTQPLIVEPAFLRDQSGKIAPHKMVWPSYWGTLREGKVQPLLPEAVARAAGEQFPKQTAEEAERDPYNTRPLTDAQIKGVLAALGKGVTNGSAVFLAAGKLYRLEGEQLTSEEHDAAKPYAWPLAHDVRSASQALGVKGCADCHSEDSPIYFASVTARGPVDPANGVTHSQLAMRGDDQALVSTFAFTFNFRPTLKIITFACALLVLGVLLNRGLAWVGGARSSEERD